VQRPKARHDKRGYGSRNQGPQGERFAFQETRSCVEHYASRHADGGTHADRRNRPLCHKGRLPPKLRLRGFRPSWGTICGVTGNWRSRRVGEFTRPQNVQTADVREPEPRPAVELPILRNNALVPRPGSSATRLPCRRRSGSWTTLDLHYGVREGLTSGSPVNFQMRRHAEVSASGWQPDSVLWDSELPSGWIGKRRPVWA
jgi:hypothetical protein